MIQDAYRHHLSGPTNAAVTAYDDAVRTLNLVRGNAIGLFDAAHLTAPDPRWRIWAKPGFAVANAPGLMTKPSPRCRDDRRQICTSHTAR
jgi:hypothetical protein